VIGEGFSAIIFCGARVRNWPSACKNSARYTRTTNFAGPIAAYPLGGACPQLARADRASRHSSTAKIAIRIAGVANGIIAERAAREAAEEAVFRRGWGPGLTGWETHHGPVPRRATTAIAAEVQQQEGENQKAPARGPRLR
jgi:hypothetical protein